MERRMGNVSPASNNASNIGPEGGKIIPIIQRGGWNHRLENESPAPENASNIGASGGKIFPEIGLFIQLLKPGITHDFEPQKS